MIVAGTAARKPQGYAAVAITLEALTKNGLNMEKDFVMVDDAYFWRFVSKGVKKITL